MDKMREFKDKGWHPKGKQGGSESWRGDFKGVNHVAGWLAKGKDSGSTSSAEASSHVSAPLASLRDPASFGPPPKKNPSFPIESPTTPHRTGAASSHAVGQHANSAIDKPAPPPVPFRVNTTGLSTDNLPAPPTHIVHRDPSTASHTTSTAPPVSAASSRPQQALPPSVPPKPKPALPPRLPPRSSGGGPPLPPPHQAPMPRSPPPPYNLSHASYSPSSSTTNAQDTLSLAAAGHTTTSPSYNRAPQNALNRLGAAGVTVPGFGIGGPSSTPPNNKAYNNNNTNTSTSTSTNPNSTNDGAGVGTSFAQKQAAFNTAQAFRKDPASVSLTDARGAASTARNFQARHGEQVKKGWGVAGGALNAMNGGGGAEGGAGRGEDGSVGGGGGGGGKPPPVPLATRPT